MNIAKFTHLLVSVFNDSGFAELVRGIWQARISNHHVIHNALVSHTYVRYDLYTHQLRHCLMPNTSMDERAFIRWLAWSEFGQAILAIATRPQTTYELYRVDNSLPVWTDIQLPAPHKSSPLKTEETIFKRLAASVFLFVLRSAGRAEFHPTSEPAASSRQFTPDVIEAMDEFVNGSLSESDFFAGKHIKKVFAPDSFYQQLIDAAGYVINTDADYFKKNWKSEESKWN